MTSLSVVDDWELFTHFMIALGTSGNKDTAFGIWAWSRRLYNPREKKKMERKKKKEGIPE